MFLLSFVNSLSLSLSLKNTRRKFHLHHYVLTNLYRRDDLFSTRLRGRARAPILVARLSRVALTVRARRFPSREKNLCALSSSLLRRDFSVNERACGTKKRHKIGFPLARRGGWRHLFCPSRATERYNNDDDNNNNNNNNTLFKGLMFCVNRYALFIFEFFFSSFHLAVWVVTRWQKTKISSLTTN